MNPKNVANLLRQLADEFDPPAHVYSPESDDRADILPPTEFAPLPYVAPAVNQTVPVTPFPNPQTVSTAPVAVMARPEWQVGMIHAQGHNPLKSNRRGLFCPTRIGKDANGNGIFCEWRP